MNHNMCGSNELHFVLNSTRIKHCGIFVPSAQPSIIPVQPHVTFVPLNFINVTPFLFGEGRGKSKIPKVQRLN